MLALSKTKMRFFFIFLHSRPQRSFSYFSRSRKKRSISQVLLVPFLSTVYIKPSSVSAQIAATPNPDECIVTGV
jgi:hypothetical protein